MRSLILRWLAAFVAVLLAATLFPDHIRYETLGAAALFAAILALLNMFVKPLLALLTAPISCLTLGLFVLVINAFLFWLAAQFTGGSAVWVEGAVGAFIGGLVVSLVSMVMSKIT